MVPPLNTHFYDGQWRHRYQQIVDQQGAIPIVAIEDIKRALDSNDHVDSHVKWIATQILSLIEQDDSSSNYDAINHIHARDILQRTWYQVKQLPEEDHVFFYIQLFEMTLGTCSQGRTTRLFQVLATFFPSL